MIFGIITTVVTAVTMAKLFAVPVDQLFIDDWNGSDGQ